MVSVVCPRGYFQSELWKRVSSQNTPHFPSVDAATNANDLPFVGVWAMRNVRKQKVASASLFDQRRMRLQSANGSSAISSAKKYSHSVIQRKDSMETVELIPISGAGKIPKSPAPNPTSDSYLETV